MPAVSNQQLLARIERLSDVKLGDGAGRASTDSLAHLDDDDRAVELFGQAPGDQSHDARHKVGGGGKEQRQFTIRRRQLTRALLSIARELLALAVQPAQFARQPLRVGGVLGLEQLVGDLGVGHPPGGVDPGRQRIGDGGSVHLPRLQPGLLAERLDARSLHPVEARQPLADQGAILTQQGHHVGHGSQGDQIQKLLLLQRYLLGGYRGLAVAAQERLGQPVGDAHPGQFAKRVTAVLSLGVDHAHRLGQLVADGVMVGDDDVEAQPVGVGDFFQRADAAIHRDDDADAILHQLGQGSLVQSIPLVHAVGDVGTGMTAKCAQRLDQERRRRDAIGVEIAIDGDQLARAQRPAQSSDGSGHALKGKGIHVAIFAVEKSRCLDRIGDTPAVEHLDDDRGQVGETSDITGWCRWRDLPTFRTRHSMLRSRFQGAS